MSNDYQVVVSGPVGLVCKTKSKEEANAAFGEWVRKSLNNKDETSNQTVVMSKGWDIIYTHDPRNNIVRKQS